MTDLCEKLILRLRDENHTLKDKVFKLYSKYLGRLQKKPVIMDMLEADWEMFKYHMTYLLLCTAVAEMEKCLNYSSWGLQPPNAPPGPEEEYEGDFVEKYSEHNSEDEKPKEEKKESDTEEDEAILTKIESEMIKEFGDDALSTAQTINLNLGMGVRFCKDDRTKEELEIDEMEEEAEFEEEIEEEHMVEDEQQKLNFIEEGEEEELYEEEMSEEEMSLTTLINEDHILSDLENEDENEGDYIDDDEDAEEGDGEQEEEEEEEEEEGEEEEEDEYDGSIEEEEEINEEKELEHLEKITEKIKLLIASGSEKVSIKKSANDSRKKKEPTSKPQAPMSKMSLKVGEKDQPVVEEPEKPKHSYGSPASFIQLKENPPPWARTHFLFFAEIQWRQILADTIDDIAVVIESINIQKGPTPKSNIQDSERAKYPCD